MSESKKMRVVLYWSNGDVSEIEVNKKFKEILINKLDEKLWKDIVIEEDHPEGFFMHSLRHVRQIFFIPDQDEQYSE